MFFSATTRAGLLVAGVLIRSAAAEETPEEYSVIFKSQDCVLMTGYRNTDGFLRIVESHGGSVADQHQNDLWRGAAVIFQDAGRGKAAAALLEEDDCVEVISPSPAFQENTDESHFIVVGDQQLDLYSATDDDDEDDEDNDRAEVEDEGPRLRRRSTDTPTYAPHVMAGVEELHKMGYTGQGVTVAIIDTGIDYNHPELGNGCYGKPDCLVIGGWNFVENNTDVMDCHGHGTHVAGIIAAQPTPPRHKAPSKFIGAAPGVNLLVYRVSGCKGDKEGWDLAGLDRAYQDGAHIISYSRSAPGYEFTGGALALAQTRLMEKGIPIFQATGNNGHKGLFYNESPVKGVVGVASFNNLYENEWLERLNYTVDGGRKKGGGVSILDPESRWGNMSSLPLWAGEPHEPTLDPCVALPDTTPDLGSYLVLAGLDNCTMEDTLPNLVARGAKHIVYYNRTPGSLAEDLITSIHDGVPELAVVNTKLGLGWARLLRIGSSIAVSLPGPDSSPVPFFTRRKHQKGPLMKQTSWGPTWDMDINPHVGAPGGSIISTWLVKFGKYSVQSGTSMACPIITAVYAIVFAAFRGQISQPHIRNRILTSASPASADVHGGSDRRRAPVTQQGSGLINARRAVLNQAAIFPESISFNDTDAFFNSATFELHNLGLKTASYSIHHRPSVTLYALGQDMVTPQDYPNDAIDGVSASLKFSTNYVQVGPLGRTELTVTVTPPAGLNPRRLPYWSGYIWIRGSDGTFLSVPHQGLGGSIRKATILDPHGTWIASSADGERIPPMHSFNITRKELPHVVFNISLATPEVNAWVVPQIEHATLPSVELWGERIMGKVHGCHDRDLARIQKICEWNGKLHGYSGLAPAGTYKIMVTAKHLRAPDGSSERADWDVGETDWFTIQY